MSRKLFKLRKSGQVPECPKCMNDIEFIFYSEQVAEDSCDLWVTCKCGYDPTDGKVGHRVESVWGGCGEDNIIMALQNWKDEITEMNEQDAQG